MVGKKKKSWGGVREGRERKKGGKGVTGQKRECKNNRKEVKEKVKHDELLSEGRRHELTLYCSSISPLFGQDDSRLRGRIYSLL